VNLDIVVLGLLAGLDNLQVCSALGLLDLERRRVHLLAACFGASEIFGAVAGLLLGHTLSATLSSVVHYAAPLLVLGCGMAIFSMAWRRDQAGRMTEQPAFLCSLPFTLSLDNLVAGTAVGLSNAPLLRSAVTIGCISGGMSCLGLYSGAWVRRFLPERVDLLVGGYLCFLSMRMAMMDTN
jgi:putative Mn2+ efflux pump MntP